MENFPGRLVKRPIEIESLARWSPYGKSTSTSRLTASGTLYVVRATMAHNARRKKPKMHPAKFTPEPTRFTVYLRPMRDPLTRRERDRNTAAAARMPFAARNHRRAIFAVRASS